MPRAKKTRMKTVGIVVRPGAPDVALRAQKLAAWLEERKCRVLAHRDWAGSRAARSVVARAQMMRSADLVVVLGGDGSLLGVARLSGRSPVPVVGINHGDFGFLTESDRGNLYATMERILSGDFTIEKRLMLAAEIRRGDKRIVRAQALNDAVITRGSVSRMLTLEAAVNGAHLTTYQGDGLIVATPTGSTAYSLSAGGPVVDPSMRALLITPISPHTLTSRPIVLDDRARVSISIPPGCDDAVLTLDGQETFELRGGDAVVVTRSANHAAIVNAGSGGFYEALRRKINFGVRGATSKRSNRAKNSGD